jgi:amino acid transporter
MKVPSRIAPAVGTLLVCCALDLVTVLLAVIPEWYNWHTSYSALTSPPTPAALELIRQVQSGYSLSLYDTIVHGPDWRILIGAVLLQCLGLVIWLVCRHIAALHKVASIAAMLSIICCVLIGVIISLRVFSPPNNGTVIATDPYLGYRVVLDIIPTTLAYFGVGLILLSIVLAAATVRLEVLDRRSVIS